MPQLWTELNKTSQMYSPRRPWLSHRFGWDRQSDSFLLQTENGGECLVVGGVLASPCLQQEAVFSCGDLQTFDFLF